MHAARRARGIFERARRASTSKNALRHQGPLYADEDGPDATLNISQDRENIRWALPLQAVMVEGGWYLIASGAGRLKTTICAVCGTLIVIILHKTPAAGHLGRHEATRSPPPISAVLRVGGVADGLVYKGID